MSWRLLPFATVWQVRPNSPKGGFRVAFFSVMVQGTGLSIKLPDQRQAIAGFFATRIVWAESAEYAERFAIDRVSREWMAEPYKSQSGAGSVVLSPEACRPVGFVQGLLARPTGFTFFAAAE